MAGAAHPHWGAGGAEGTQRGFLAGLSSELSLLPLFDCCVCAQGLPHLPSGPVLSEGLGLLEFVLIPGGNPPRTFGGQWGVWGSQGGCGSPEGGVGVPRGFFAASWNRKQMLQGADPPCPPCSPSSGGETPAQSLWWGCSRAGGTRAGAVSCPVPAEASPDALVGREPRGGSVSPKISQQSRVLSSHPALTPQPQQGTDTRQGTQRIWLGTPWGGQGGFE